MPIDDVEPGWGVTHNPYANLDSVVWIDGTRDVRGTEGGSDRVSCVQCETPLCLIPVHMEQYKIKASRIASQWDKDNPVIGAGSPDDDCKC